MFMGLTVAALACGPIDLAREILGRLPTETPIPRSEEHTSLIWYVAPDGDDANGCAFPDNACLTINGAADKATEFDVIQVAPGTYNDSGSSTEAAIVTITKSLAIVGAGSDQTFIDALNAITGVYVRNGANLRLENVTIRNGGGRAPGNCLSVRNGAGATIRNSTLQHCSPAGIEHSSEGDLHLINVLVSDAQPPIDGVNQGFGIISGPGALFIEDSEIRNNTGDGIISFGSLEMTDTLVTGNGLEGITVQGTASLTGITIRNNAVHPELGHNHAGLRVSDTGNATVVGSTVRENDVGVWVRAAGRLILQDTRVELHPRNGLIVEESADVNLDGAEIVDNGSIYIDTSIPGGIDLRGRMTMHNSHVVANRNGGILVSSGASLTLVDSTIDGNRDSFPGLWNQGDAIITSSTISNNEYMGIDNRGTMQILNSTLSGNVGNGITAVEGSLRLAHVTIADNGGNGLNAFEGGTTVASVSNVLISNNTVEDCEISSRVGIMPIPVAGTNLDTDGTCLFTGSTGSELGLEPLADNGGPTLTHALREGSPAIDAGLGTCPSTDQRGNARPVGASCDVGAYEYTFAVTGIEPTSGDAPAPTVNIDLLCWEGPGPAYNVVSSIEAGTEVELHGTGLNISWLIIDNPRFPGASCWVAKEKLDVDPDLDLGEFQIFPVPPLPTATPVPGCLYQGPNDPQATCYPLDLCPVPFDQSLGACTP
jgi:uncharacterized protein YraI